MSHYTVMETAFVDTSCLVEALKALGLCEVEVHSEKTNLYGFQGDVRPQQAEIVVRRQYVGSASNDIGFARQANGTYTAIISDYDRHRYNDQWIGKLKQQYAKATTIRELQKKRFKITEETMPDGRIRIVGTRTA